MLDFRSPEWASLVDELEALRAEVQATNVIVFDAWTGVWCRAKQIEESDYELVDDLIAAALDAAPRRLERGGRLDALACGARGAWHARSYAGVYVVLVWGFSYAPGVPSSAARERQIRKAVASRLADIEALTLALPPSDGPQATSGAAAKRGA